MKLLINSTEVNHIPAKSRYNHNYYKVINQFCQSTEILEVCHEDYDFFTYYLVEGDKETFLGSSEDHIHDNCMVNIDFGVYFT
jgi:hypothetical protein